MTRETKAGLVVSCSFLCLVGVVLFSKVNEKEGDSTNGGDKSESMEPQPVPPNKLEASPGKGAPFANVREAERHNAPGGVVPAGYRTDEERENSNSKVPFPAPANEPTLDARAPLGPPAVKGSSGPATSPALKLENESPTIHLPPLAKTTDAPAGIVTKSPGEKPATEPAKVVPAPAQPPASAVPPTGTLAQLPKEAERPTPSAPKTDAPLAGAPLPDPAKSVATVDNAASKVVSGDATSPTSLNKGGNSLESKDSGTKSAVSAPSGLGGSFLGGAATNKPATSGAAPPPISPWADFKDKETPKIVQTGATQSAVTKDQATRDGVTKQEAPLPVSVPSDAPKPLFQVSAPLPPLAGVVSSPKTPTPSPDKLPIEGTKPASTPPVDSRPASGTDQPKLHLGGDHQLPRPADQTPTVSPAAAGPPAPKTTNLFTFPSTDTLSRPNVTPGSPPNPGPAGSTPEVGTRAGGDRSLTGPAPVSPDRKPSSMPEPTLLRPAAAPSPGETGTEKKSNPQSTVPGAASSQPTPLAPAPPASTPSALSSTGQSTLRPLPPFEALASAVKPPAAVAAPPQPLAGSSPLVESYDEDTYTCKATDTFRTISQQVYHTDQYERALMLFNRNHPLASNALRQDPPVLQAGQPVYLPPVRILEKYYGAPPIDSAAPKPSAPPTRGTERPEPAGSLRPATPPSLTLGAAVKPSPPQDSIPVYRVRAGGEMIREIARRTLGNAERWSEIYLLNQGFDPKEPIPGGSQLRLPKDARVDPQDRPPAL